MACRTAGAVQFDSHMAESLLPNLLLKTTKFDPAAERDLPVVGRVATPPLGDADIRRSTRDRVVYAAEVKGLGTFRRSEEHTSELQSLMRISYAVFCLKKKKQEQQQK